MEESEGIPQTRGRSGLTDSYFLSIQETHRSLDLRHAAGTSLWRWRSAGGWVVVKGPCGCDTPRE